MRENFQGDSWGSIPPLRMPSLLSHDLCHRQSSSRWLPAVQHHNSDDIDWIMKLENHQCIPKQVGEIWWGSKCLQSIKISPHIWLISCHCCSVKSCPTLCDPMDCSIQAFPVLHHLPEFAQTHVHWVGDAIQPSHPQSPPSPSALSLFQHQCLFQWVSSSYQVAKVLELQQQSF